MSLSLIKMVPQLRERRCSQGEKRIVQQKDEEKESLPERKRNENRGKSREKRRKAELEEEKESDTRVVSKV